MCRKPIEGHRDPITRRSAADANSLGASGTRRRTRDRKEASAEMPLAPPCLSFNPSVAIALSLGRNLRNDP
jgi:hypothetical protein